MTALEEAFADALRTAEFLATVLADLAAELGLDPPAEVARFAITPRTPPSNRGSNAGGAQAHATRAGNTHARAGRACAPRNPRASRVPRDPREEAT